jgi:uncharacterized protein YbjT (DUF2867 family)
VEGDAVIGETASLANQSQVDAAPSAGRCKDWCMRVLVIGASGYIGSHLVPLLVERGHQVRAAARRREVLEGRGWNGVELQAADVLDEESLVEALHGIDAAYYLVHSMGGGKDFAIRDRRAARNFRDAAAAAGVKRIIYLGGVVPGGPPSQHLKSRLETGDILREGSVPVTELRAGVIVGAGSAGFEVLRDLVNHLPVMVTPRWVKSLTQPIALDDLLSYLVGVLDHPETTGQAYDVSGPELLRYRDMLVQFGEVVGKRPRLIAVPVLSPRVSTYWLDLVTSVPASVAGPLVEGLRNDTVANDSAIREIMPVPLHTYKEAVIAALTEEQAATMPARWEEGALAFRGYDPSVSFYSKGHTETVYCEAPAEALWSVISSMGGTRGYFYANYLWGVRGLFDRLVGGVGMRRGRRHPTELRPGDAIDFWRVAAVEPGRRLTLVAEMKLPGAAMLELEALDAPEGYSKLVMTARFNPAGMLGLLYWYGIYPVHNLIFRRMPVKMARAAEEEWAARSSVETPTPV